MSIKIGAIELLAGPSELVATDNLVNAIISFIDKSHRREVSQAKMLFSFYFFSNHRFRILFIVIVKPKISPFSFLWYFEIAIPDQLRTSFFSS